MSSPSASQATLALYRPTRPGGARRGRTVAGWAFGFFIGMAALVGGVLIGLELTAAALRSGEEIGAVTVGDWRLPVGEGTPGINPYQRAVLARTGAIPMSAGQGVAFTAGRDDARRKLDRRCTYTVRGEVPRARFWTLTAVDAAGFAMANEADRYAFTSDDVVRDESGAFTVVLSPDVQPGNWLPLRGHGRFGLVLRLYDSAVPGLGTRELAALTMPSIVPGGCP